MDRSTSWLPLKELKESNPVETAKYAVAMDIEKKPAFAWWVKHVLKKQDKIIKKVKARVSKKMHMFGIEVPDTVKEALEPNKMNDNDLWQKAIDKEMQNVKVAF